MPFPELLLRSRVSQRIKNLLQRCEAQQTFWPDRDSSGTPGAVEGHHRHNSARTPPSGLPSDPQLLQEWGVAESQQAAFKDPTEDEPSQNHCNQGQHPVFAPTQQHTVQLRTQSWRQQQLQNMRSAQAGEQRSAGQELVHSSQGFAWKEPLCLQQAHPSHCFEPVRLVLKDSTARFNNGKVMHLD